MEIFSRHVHEQPKIKLIMTITNYSNIIGAFTAFFFFFFFFLHDSDRIGLH